MKDQNFEILDRRAGRISEGTHQLASVLDGIDMGGGITAHLRASTQLRAVLLLTGPRLSDAITDTDPGAGRAHEGVLPATERVLGDPEATRTASVVNAFIEQSHAILSEHPINKMRIERNLLPANGLLTRGAGKVTRLRNLIQHLGIRSAVVTGEGTVVGLARMFRYDIITHPRFTASTDTDLALKVEATLQALNYNDLVYLHIKGTDTSGHDQLPERKAAFIEKADAALAPLCDEDIVLGIASDHSTDSNMGRHTGDPVPVILASPEGRRDDVTTFSESACMKGGLGHLSPTAFLAGLLDQMNQMHPLRAGEHIFY
jgi:2,3-bisphosphoglycerate-independent phosphoglycerate mutase